jgi:uncharacterized protein YecA (UPF0149 family)
MSSDLQAETIHLNLEGTPVTVRVRAIPPEARSPALDRIRAVAAALLENERWSRYLDLASAATVPATFDQLRARMRAIEAESLQDAGFSPQEVHEVMRDPEWWGAPRLDPGRNDPCSCGSGVKFKRCCGR